MLLDLQTNLIFLDDLENCPELSYEDLWILSEFNETLKIVNKSWSDIDIYSASQTIKSFSTGIFPSHWLEMSKKEIIQWKY